LTVQKKQKSIALAFVENAIFEEEELKKSLVKVGGKTLISRKQKKTI